MEQAQLTELDLVVKMRDAKVIKEKAEKALDEAEQVYDTTEQAIIEMLNAKGATKTATYEGVGYVSLAKPQLYASVLKENEDKLFDFLRSIDRQDLIKTAVSPKSLSTLVKAKMENGEEVPEYVTYYIKTSAKFKEI